MNETKILNNIKRELYDMVVEFYNNYSQNKSKVNLELYNNVIDLYKKINSCKSFDEVREYLDDIQKELASLKEKFNAKIEEHKKTKNEAIMQEIKDISKVAQVLTDVYSKVKVTLPKKTKVTKVEPKQEQKVEQKQEQVKPKKLVNTEGIDFNIQEVKEIQNLTSQIIKLKEELSSIDPLSKEAITIRKNINDLCNQRLHIAYQQFGYDGMNYIREVESMETRYANHQEDKNTSSYELDSLAYETQLEGLLSIIGDLKFNGIKSSYVAVNESMTNNEKLKAYQEVYSKYMGEYLNLVKSLHNTNNPTIYSYGDYTVTSTDLLNYLSIYNLKGGFQTFKEHHKTGKVGSEAVTKEMYAAGLDKIEGFVSSFKIISRDLIKNKGGKITISNQNITKEDLKIEMEQKLADFYKMITKKQQQKTM